MLVKMIVVGVVDMQNTENGPLFSLKEEDVNKPVIK
jgi:hypothetical protein